MPAFSHQSANQLATAQRRAVMAFSRATRGQRAVAFMLLFYGCLGVQCVRKFYGKKILRGGRVASSNKQSSNTDF